MSTSTNGTVGINDAGFFIDLLWQLLRLQDKVAFTHGRDPEAVSNVTAKLNDIMAAIDVLLVRVDAGVHLDARRKSECGLCHTGECRVHDVEFPCAAFTHIRGTGIPSTKRKCPGDGNPLCQKCTNFEKFARKETT